MVMGSWSCLVVQDKQIFLLAQWARVQASHPLTKSLTKTNKKKFRQLNFSFIGGRVRLHVGQQHVRALA